MSGNFNAKNVKISKRGSSYLRWAIHTSASLTIHYDDNFSRFYAKKRKAGKHHLVAIGHVTKKLTRVLFHVLKHNSAFVPQN
jgi:transposase